MLCVSGTCKHTSHGAVLSNMIIFGQNLLGGNTWSNNYRLRKCRNLSFSLHFYDRNAAVIFFFSILKYTGKNFIISLFISSICLAKKYHPRWRQQRHIQYTAYNAYNANTECYHCLYCFHRLLCLHSFHCYHRLHCLQCLPCVNYFDYFNTVLTTCCI